MQVYFFVNFRTKQISRENQFSIDSCVEQSVSNEFVFHLAWERKLRRPFAKFLFFSFLEKLRKIQHPRLTFTYEIFVIPTYDRRWTLSTSSVALHSMRWRREVFFFEKLELFVHFMLIKRDQVTSLLFSPQLFSFNCYTPLSHSLYFWFLEIANVVIYCSSSVNFNRKIMKKPSFFCTCVSMTANLYVRFTQYI